jgi:hypothetical protein
MDTYWHLISVHVLRLHMWIAQELAVSRTGILDSHDPIQFRHRLAVSLLYDHRPLLSATSTYAFRLPYSDRGFLFFVIGYIVSFFLWSPYVASCMTATFSALSDILQAIGPMDYCIIMVLIPNFWIFVLPRLTRLFRDWFVFLKRDTSAVMINDNP